MGKAIPLMIGDKAFLTKGLAEKFIQEILYRHTIGQLVQDADAVFLFNLLKIHPEAEEKIRCGVATFSVRQNPGSRGFWLTRIDGSETDWSFKSCLKAPTPEQEAKAGFREAIRVQKTAFLERYWTQSGPKICELSNEVILSKNVAHVDHIIPFEKLLNAFLTLHGYVLADVRVLPTRDGSTITELADSALSLRWQAYHLQHAQLRVVTATANLKRPRRKGSD